MSSHVTRTVTLSACLLVVACSGDDDAASSLAMPIDDASGDPMVVTNVASMLPSPDEQANPMATADIAAASSSDASSNDSTTVTEIDAESDERAVPTASGVDVSPLAEVNDVPPGAVLRVTPSPICASVDEAFEISVDLESSPAAEGEEVTSTDVSASVTLTQSGGQGLEILSRGDGAIALRMTEPGIIEPRVELDDGVAVVTTDSRDRDVRFAGFALDAPPSALMRKPIEGGCVFALRLAGSAFCGTALARNGGRSTIGNGDTRVTVENCDYEGPDGLPLIDLK